jgi:hypothetical protein
VSGLAELEKVRRDDELKVKKRKLATGLVKAMFNNG